MSLGLIRMRHRWGFLTDEQLESAAEAAQLSETSQNHLQHHVAESLAEAGTSTLALVGLRDRLSAHLLITADSHHAHGDESDQLQRRPDRPLLLAADAGAEVAPQLLQAFQPAWRGCASAGHEWQLARALFPADNDQARLVVALVDAPEEIQVTMRLDRHQGQAIPAAERFLLAAPVGGETWREWHVLLPAADQLALDQLLRRPFVLDWTLHAEARTPQVKAKTKATDQPSRQTRGKIVCDLYRDSPFLDQ
jgi:hypothetical protein